MESSLYILIPLSLVLVFAIGAVFWWSVKSGQYDDLDGPAYKLLFDDEDTTKEDVAKAQASDEARIKAGK